MAKCGVSLSLRGSDTDHEPRHLLHLSPLFSVISLYCLSVKRPKPLRYKVKRMWQRCAHMFTEARRLVKLQIDTHCFGMRCSTITCVTLRCLNTSGHVVQLLLIKFNVVFISLLQGNGGEAEGQVPSPRVLHLYRLRHQPKTEGTFLCGGPDLL